MKGSMKGVLARCMVRLGFGPVRAPPLSVAGDLWTPRGGQDISERASFSHTTSPPGARILGPPPSGSPWVGHLCAPGSASPGGRPLTLSGLHHWVRSSRRPGTVSRVESAVGGLTDEATRRPKEAGGEGEGEKNGSLGGVQWGWEPLPHTQVGEQGVGQQEAIPPLWQNEPIFWWRERTWPFSPPLPSLIPHRGVIRAAWALAGKGPITGSVPMETGDSPVLQRGLGVPGGGPHRRQEMSHDDLSLRPLCWAGASAGNWPSPEPQPLPTRTAGRCGGARDLLGPWGQSPRSEKEEGVKRFGGKDEMERKHFPGPTSRGHRTAPPTATP